MHLFLRTEWIGNNIQWIILPLYDLNSIKIPVNFHFQEYIPSITIKTRDGFFWISKLS